MNSGAAASGWSQADLAYMHTALEAAGNAAKLDEVPVGAVVVVAGEVVGIGHNRTISDTDPSAHAEVLAIRDASRRMANHRLTDATLYVTLEPCAMCVGALVQARIDRLVFGAYDRKAGALGSVIDLSDSAAFNHRFDVNGGLLEAECAALLESFFRTRRLQRR